MPTAWADKLRDLIREDETKEQTQYATVTKALQASIAQLSEKLQRLLDKLPRWRRGARAIPSKASRNTGRKETFAGANRANGARRFDMGRTDETMDRNCRFYL